MKKSKIFFRADGDANIGLGHIFRCLALIEILKDYFECIFVTRVEDHYLTREIKKSCSSFIKLSEKKNKHFNEFIALIEKDDIVVLDNYFFTTDYQKQIKAVGCKLVCIDDMHDKHYVADVVINHGIGLKDEQFSTESYTDLYLGWNYALIRKPFFNVIARKRMDLRRCLICIGGADKHNITSKIIKLLEDIKIIKVIDVIISSTFLFKSELDNQIYNCTKEVNLFNSLTAPEMVERMQIADFGILPASTVSVEAAAVGMPFLTGFYAENQKEYYYNLLKTKKYFGLGDLLKLNKLDESLFKDKIIDVFNDSFSTEKIVNIFNGFRYINKINKVSFINYVDLNNLNKEKVLELRNQHDIRKWMKNTNKISIENHFDFIDNLKKFTDKFYFAAFINNVLIGCVSVVDCNSDTCSVGLFLENKFRGDGIELAYFSQQYAFNFLDLKEIIINVHVDNKNAIDYNIFLGYKLFDLKSSWLYFRLLNDKIINNYETYLKKCIKNFNLNKNEYKRIYKTFCRTI